MNKNLRLLIVTTLLSLGAIYADANFDLDVDDDGKTEALTDGLLIIRHSFGFSGESLVTGAVGNNASRSTAPDIEAYVKANQIQLDVDGDGEVAPLTDGLLIIRSLFGFSGTSLSAGAIATNALRTDGLAVATYLETITDSDNDNTNDAFDAFPRDATETVDTDGDSIGDNLDLDDDNDGVADTADAFSLISLGGLTDTDGDGRPNDCDSDCQTLGMAADPDDDNDGVADTADAFSLISLGGLTDTDGDGRPNDCDSDCQTLGMTADPDDDNDGVIDEKDIDPINSQFPLKIWTKTNSQRWKGSELEGLSPLCKDERSFRWIAPVTGFDLNKDNKSDLLLPISCYQGSLPHPPKHNQKVIGEWKMFCSKGEEHVDCTNELFGSDFINATGTDSGGGNPYIHVMATPEDINNDGYPDFWYALNRDDGRPSFDPSVDEDRILLESYCGPEQGEWDCTRKAIQSVLLSATDGSYGVVTLPWGETNTQAMYVLPNDQGSIDVISVNFGRGRAARLDGRVFIDVTEEYESSVKNWAYVSVVNPYIKAFSHEGQSYFVSPRVPYGYILDPAATEFTQEDKVPLSVNLRYGFTLWKWVPEVGFELSDVYQPAESEVFSYQFQEGEEVYTRYGAVIQGIPTFTPNWHFFEYIKLSEDDEPILVVVQESNRGITLGDYFGAPVSSELIYKDSGSSGGQLFSALSETEKERSLDFQFQPVQSFSIQNGKLVLRSQSFVEGDVVYNTPGFKFSDLNGDGHLDLIGLAGGANKGTTFINDAGTMRRLNLQYAFPAIDFSVPLEGDFGFTIRNLGIQNRPEFIYWSSGSYEPKAPNDFVILEASESIDDLPFIGVEEMMKIFSLCGKTSSSQSCLY